MFRYNIYVYTAVNDKIIRRDYDARHFEVNNISLTIYPTDFSASVYIHLTDKMRIVINPYNYHINS